MSLLKMLEWDISSLQAFQRDIPPKYPCIEDALCDEMMIILQCLVILWNSIPVLFPPCFIIIRFPIPNFDSLLNTYLQLSPQLFILNP